MEIAEIVRLACKAVRDDDAAAFRALLDEHPALKEKINDPVASFDSPVILSVRSNSMLDALLDAGADINARSQWWAGGFGLLDCADPVVAAYAIERSANVTVHAAARLGMIGKLRELIDADPKLVHARGGDGQLPLHFASTVEIAGYLLDHGAEIDARDVDHESTAAQYMLGDRNEVLRYLIGRGCRTDILMAAALGDIELVKRHLDADPECVRMRVSDEYFPIVGSSKAGGTIYQWKLGWHVSACQVAKARGHTEIVDLLMRRSPAGEKLLNACWLHDEQTVRALIAEDPDLAAKLPPAGRRQLAHAARNNDTEAVRLMLAAGLPVLSFSQDHGTPLHWAAWHGNAEMTRLILAHDPPIENTENDHGGTPLEWAIHGSENGWHCRTGDYAATVEALFGAGARMPRMVYGTEAVREAIARYGKGIA